MADRYGELAFTPSVKRLQEAHGSRRAYARQCGNLDFHAVLGAHESAFIADREDFYVATVSETGWPYVQYRGGPKGLLRLIDSKTLGFADFRGNKQYITAGNVTQNDRVALLLIDFSSRQRLKLFGYMHAIDASENTLAAETVTYPGYDAVIERVWIINVQAFNWNCSQHIQRRLSEDELLKPQVAPFA